MTLNTASNVVDMLADSASAALASIIKSSAAVTDTAKRTRAHWRTYGASLRTKRKSCGNTEFGRWVHDNGLDKPPADDVNTRTAAMWLDECWDEIDRFITSDETEYGDMHHPRTIYDALHKAGVPCAQAKPTKSGKPKATGKTKRPKQPKQPAPRKISYVEVIVQGTGGNLPISINEIYRRGRNGIRNELDAEWVKLYGEKLPEHKSFDPVNDAAACAALVRIYQQIAAARAAPAKPQVAQQPAQQQPTPEDAWQQAQSEKDQLPASQQSRVDKVIAKLRAALQAKYAEDVEAGIRAQVKERTESMRKYLSEELERVKQVYLDDYMTEAEFNQINFCLHTDTARSRTDADLNRAFQVFQRLKARLNPNKKARESHGWK